MKSLGNILISLFYFLPLAGIAFVVYMTRSLPPIETYTYPRSESELLDNLRAMNATSAFEITFTDTIGDLDDEHKLFFTILDTDSCLFRLNYLESQEDEIEIYLWRAIDYKAKTGGLSNGDKEVMTALKNHFEAEVLSIIVAE